MKKLYRLLGLLSLLIILSSWGYTGHRKISQPAAPALPDKMEFLKGTWTSVLTEHASDADYRKNQDPDEAPRHYIDIDNYPGFTQSHKIPMSWDSVVALYGSGYVIDNGILPWATKTAFDSVKACFLRKDFSKAALFAADLGHYVGDGHMPLHITKNYNGQLTGQSGVHSRYETKMINSYSGQIIFNPDEAVYLADVSSYIFTYLYDNYNYVDSVLLADQQAYLATGSYTSSEYLASLWSGTGIFTTDLFSKASQSLSDLIYTAWVDAGSPYPVGIAEPPVISSVKDIFPNPASGRVTIPFEIIRTDEAITLTIMSEDGKTVGKFPEIKNQPGLYDVTWEADSASAGVYFAVLRSGRNVSVKRFVIVK